MIAHTGVNVTDYGKSKEFYLKLLTPLGYHISYDMPEYKACGFMQGGNTDFWIGESEPTGHSHVAFLVDGPDAVAAFHEAGLAAGGKDNGAPGPRPDYSPGYYAAFILDPDGHNVEAVWFDPEKEAAG